MRTKAFLCYLFLNFSAPRGVLVYLYVLWIWGNTAATHSTLITDHILLGELSSPINAPETMPIVENGYATTNAW